MKMQLICAVVIPHHPMSYDIKHFPELFQQMMIIAVPWIFVLNKGYDAEWVHRMIQNQKILSMISVRNRGCLINRTHGRYRKQMRRKFDESVHHQRNKCQTIFSVIKRKFGSEIKSYNNTMKEKESLYRVLAYNCHGTTMISCLLWMIPRKPSKGGYGFLNLV